MNEDASFGHSKISIITSMTQLPTSQTNQRIFELIKAKCISLFVLLQVLHLKLNK